MLLVSALATPFLLLALLMAMARVQEALGGEPVAEAAQPAALALEPTLDTALDPVPTPALAFEPSAPLEPGGLLGLGPVASPVTPELAPA